MYWDSIEWSDGLKDKIGIPDLTDEEILKYKEETIDLVYEMPYEYWKLLIQEKTKIQVLDMIEEEGFEGVKKWLLYYFLNWNKSLDNV